MQGDTDVGAPSLLRKPHPGASTKRRLQLYSQRGAARPGMAQPVYGVHTQRTLILGALLSRKPTPVRANKHKDLKG